VEVEELVELVEVDELVDEVEVVVAATPGRKVTIRSFTVSPL
jgi:hypothetical protein